MSSRRPWHAYHSVRITAKLVFVLALVALAAFYLWGTGWQLKVSLTFLGFFCVALMLEGVAIMQRRRSAKTFVGGANAASVSLPEKVGFNNVVTPDGDQWYEREIQVEGQAVTLRVGIDPDVVSGALPFASALADDPVGLGERFVEFQRSEATKQPTRSTEILRLKLQEINFFSSKRPDVGEVYFLDEPNGESWACIIENGTFKDLGLDT